MNQRYQVIIISLLSCSVMLQGCNSVKKTLGIDKDAPDEFSVSPSSQPLDMPPDFFALPKPCPGQPRPQDVRDREANTEKIIGSHRDKTLSPGQKAILEMAGATEDLGHVRQEVDKESRIEKAKGQPVLEQLGIRKPNSKEVINPHVEAIDLQKKGIQQTPQIQQE